MPVDALLDDSVDLPALPTPTNRIVVQDNCPPSARHQVKLGETVNAPLQILAIQNELTALTSRLLQGDAPAEVRADLQRITERLTKLSEGI